jgi:hypothetical protein
MNFTSQTVFIISADSAVARDCLEELAVFGDRYRTSVSNSIEQARERLLHTRPAAMFLDESAIDPPSEGGSLESIIAFLVETAPVVIAAAPEKQAQLGYLITSGAVDFVARVSHFLPIVAGMLERRARIAERRAGMIQFPDDDLFGDFGEILRHEVNNPPEFSEIRNCFSPGATACRRGPSSVCRPSPSWRFASAKPCAACQTPGTNITQPRDRYKKRGKEAPGKETRKKPSELRISPCLPASLPLASFLTPEQHVFALK